MSEQFPCPLCRKPLRVQASKKGKPYLTCHDCGLQMFLRYTQGIVRLHRLVRDRRSFMANFVVCEDCHVAVENMPERVSEGLLRDRGIYCPDCGRLLEKIPETT